MYNNDDDFTPHPFGRRYAENSRASSNLVEFPKSKLSARQRRKIAVVAAGSGFLLSVVIGMFFNGAISFQFKPEVSKSQKTLLAWNSESIALRNYIYEVVKWDYTTDPNIPGRLYPGKPGIYQRAVLNLATQYSKQIQLQLKNKNHPCYKAEVRDPSFCALRAIFTNVIAKELKPALEKGDDLKIISAYSRLIALTLVGYQNDYSFDLNPSETLILQQGLMQLRGNRLATEGKVDMEQTSRAIQEFWGESSGGDDK